MNEIKKEVYNNEVTVEEQKKIDKFLKVYPTDRLFAKRPATTIFLMTTVAMLALWGYVFESLHYAGVNIQYQLPIDAVVFTIAIVGTVGFIAVMTWIGVMCRDSLEAPNEA